MCRKAARSAVGDIYVWLMSQMKSEFVKRMLAGSAALMRGEEPVLHYLERPLSAFMLNMDSAVCTRTSCSPPANTEETNWC
jgi:hypothetical protein